MITVNLPIKDRIKPPMPKFPDRCTNCGQPKVTVLPLKLNMGIQKREQMVVLELPVPLCAECERRERRITNVTLVPFAIAGFLFFVLGFIPAWLLAPQGGTPQTLGIDMAVGALAGIITGVVGGSLVEIGLKMIFAPAFGRLLLNRPLTALSLFNDSEDVIGLSARFTDNKKSLSLTFENEDIANEFRKLNPQE